MPGPGAGRDGRPPWARQTWGPRVWEGLVAYAPEEKLASVRRGGPFLLEVSRRKGLLEKIDRPTIDLRITSASPNTIVAAGCWL
jgi:hypothetical protein